VSWLAAIPYTKHANENFNSLNRTQHNNIQNLTEQQTKRACNKTQKQNQQPFMALE
jgi:hypothetical protein